MFLARNVTLSQPVYVKDKDGGLYPLTACGYVCGVCLDELCASIRCCLGCGKGREEFIIPVLLPVDSWYLT